MSSTVDDGSPRSPDGSGKDEFEDTVDDPEVTQAVNDILSALEKHQISEEPAEKSEPPNITQAHPLPNEPAAKDVPATGETHEQGAKPATEQDVQNVPLANGDRKEPPATAHEEVNDEENGGSHADDGEDNDDGEQEKEEPDEDEVKESPAYIPRHGRFYMHDQRAQSEKDAEDDGEEKHSRADRKWEHDKFDERSQKPKSSTELVKRYGFDIRKAASPDDIKPPEKNQRRSDAEERSASPPAQRKPVTTKTHAPRGQAAGERPNRQRTDEPKQERRNYEKDSRAPTGPPRGPPRDNDYRNNQGQGGGYKRTFVPSRNAAEQSSRPARPQGAPFSQSAGPRNAGQADNRAPRDTGRYQHSDAEFPPLDGRNAGAGHGKRYTSQRNAGGGGGRDFESNDARNDRPRNDRAFDNGPPPRSFNRSGPPSGPPSSKYPPPRFAAAPSDRGSRQAYENSGPQYAPQHNRGGPGSHAHNGRSSTQQYPHPRQPDPPVYFDPQQQPNTGRGPVPQRERRQLQIAPPTH
ncbi:protein CASC3 [Aphelenchoides avenae]|nr:protein CASC3 [Aphelenchus avenae]